MADIDAYVDRQLAGRLTKEGERHIFAYHPDAGESLSLTMPLRVESYCFEGLHPVFQMNLPEGQLRHAIERATAKRYGSDDLTMLALLGPNQIGRIGYAFAGQPLPDQPSELPDLQTLLGSDDATLFEQLLARYAIRSGVAGVQPKVLLDLAHSPPNTIDTKLILDTKATLTCDAYIVKSWGKEFPELGCNEYFCLSLARNAGLEVPEFYVSNNGKMLISKRFDLSPHREALGFEDFCVLQGKGTREKYDASLESCTHTIRTFVSPEFHQQALYDFFKVSLINIRIRNGDAHLKNHGVVYSKLENYRTGQLPACPRQLAPIFDLVSTVPYLPNDSMALSLTGSKRWPKWKVIEQFGRQHCRLSTRQINQALGEVEDATTKTLPLLDQLVNQHLAFAPIAESLRTFLTQPIT